jgi:hypothetical protein
MTDNLLGCGVCSCVCVCANVSDRALTLFNNNNILFGIWKFLFVAREIYLCRSNTFVMYYLL